MKRGIGSAFWSALLLLGPLATAAAAQVPAAVLALPDASPSPRVARGGRAIARVWRGRTLASRADEYARYLDESGVAKILATRGNLGVTVLRREEKRETEFLVMSFWESVEAIQRFAGRDYGKAVILPRDREYLIRVEPNVDHYEVLREEIDR